MRLTKLENGYTICWFTTDKDVKIIGVMIQRDGRSDNQWTNECVKVEKLLQRGLKE